MKSSANEITIDFGSEDRIVGPGLGAVERGAAIGPLVAEDGGSVARLSSASAPQVLYQSGHCV
jgi:hypothetical protein